MHKVVTLQRHILEEETLSPKRRLEMATLMWDMMIAIKKIHNKVTQAGLVEMLGKTGAVNVQGEEVQRLDEFANDVMIKAMNHGGHLAAMASEENEDVVAIPADKPKGKYSLVFDPLDGSSNIDANVSVGTIFSVYEGEEIVRTGSEQVLAGYVVYGSSTMLVYTIGSGAHGFTFDPAMGEFYLSHPHISMPEQAEIYSLNEGYAPSFDRGLQEYLADVKSRGLIARYIGSLVADFHRNLLKGGIFLYPAVPKPKLRLVYEAFPMAWLAEQAGGAASTGGERILDMTAQELHQRVPFVVGHKDEVARYEEFMKRAG